MSYMLALLIFALVLFCAVMVSGWAERSVLSISVIFLVTGVIIGQSILDLIEVQPQNPMVERLIELAIFSVLFTDGMSFDLRQIREVWQLPGRALLLGMPLTLGAIAVLAHFLAGLSWLEALLVGAILSPTDPVFAAAIVKRVEVPERLRKLLNVESGLNDGLALPGVILMLNILNSAQRPLVSSVVELAAGLLIGSGISYLAIWVGRHLSLPPAGAYRPLHAFAIALIVLALSYLLQANLFLAAFAAGVTIATFCAEIRDAFHLFGESLTQILKLVSLLVFGALLSLSVLTSMTLSTYLFAVLVIILARPLVIELVLLYSDLTWPERAVAAWFGPKGFSSIFYVLLVVRNDVPNSNHILHVVAIVIILSILAHSSSDVGVARWLRRALDQRTAHTETSREAT
ncbi:MAG: cation:proton antiporter [Caldilineaceae bacterium]